MSRLLRVRRLSHVTLPFLIVPGLVAVADSIGSGASSQSASNSAGCRENAVYVTEARGLDLAHVSMTTG
jgi:hypothetical protein